MQDMDEEYEALLDLPKPELLAIAKNEALPLLQRFRALSVIVQRSNKDPDARQFVLQALERDGQRREWYCHMILGASHIQVIDTQERNRLQASLLKRAKELLAYVEQRGKMPKQHPGIVIAPPLLPSLEDGALWAAIRRYASLIPKEKNAVAELCHFMNPNQRQACQTAFQAVHAIFERQPAGSSEFTEVADAVKGALKRSMECQPLNPANGTLIINGMKALASLNQLSQDVTREVIDWSKNANWFADLMRKQVTGSLPNPNIRSYGEEPRRGLTR